MLLTNTKPVVLRNIPPSILSPLLHHVCYAIPVALKAQMNMFIKPWQFEDGSNHERHSGFRFVACGATLFCSNMVMIQLSAQLAIHVVVQLLPIVLTMGQSDVAMICWRAVLVRHTDWIRKRLGRQFVFGHWASEISASTCQSRPLDNSVYAVCLNACWGS